MERGVNMFLQSYSVPVKEVMSREFFKIDINQNGKESIDYLLNNIKSEVIVFDGELIVGIITMTDIHKLMTEDVSNISLDKLMSKDIIWVDSNESLFNCRSIMLIKGIGRLLICENGVIVGVLREEHMRDFFYKGLKKLS